MKKLFSKLMLVALTAMTFTACEDVPNPYDVPGTGSNVPGVAEIPGGTGEGMTPEDPYNAIAAINFGNTLQQGQTSDWRFIKGKVSKIKEQFTTQYGNATFYISVDGSHGNEFYVYRVNYLANKKFASSDPELKEGDEVVINAKITNYNGTIETSQGSGFVLEHNGVNRGGAVYPSDATTDPTIPTGVNLLTNGDFESWTDGQPDHWKTTSTAGNATLTQSTDAHGGSYSVSVGFSEDANKRLGYEEITLKAGTYTFSFYAKSTTTEKSQTQAGYVDVVNGTANSQGYKYGGYVSLNNTEWTLVSTTFTLTAETTVSLVMMNPKNSNYATAQNVLVDDATLVTADGGLVTEPTDPTDPTEPTGANILTNGDFESWTDGLPDHWKTVSTAGNATLTQSTDARSGSYSVSVGFSTSANKRLGHEEITLKAGTYTFSFYAKSTTTDASQTQAGYVDVVNGTANSQGYKYGGYVSLNNTEWTLVSTTFTLSAETTVALVMMNPKNSNYATAQNVLVDDATLVTTDGGLADGSNPTPNPDPTPDPADVQTVTIAEFNAAAESTSVWYQLTGTISNLKDGDIYGNFDLTDETGSVYVYGVLSEKGGAKKLFQDLVAQHGITNGTTITIIGNRGSYNGKIEVTNAYFVSVGK